MMFLLRRWIFRTVGLWLARRGYQWWQQRRAQEGMDPTGQGGRPDDGHGYGSQGGGRGRRGA